MARVLVLTAVTGPHIGKRYTVEERVTSIGSAPNNDMVFHDRAIAARHAEIRQILDRWFVVPLAPGSSGISINGMPITGQSRINTSDSLTLGTVTYQVSFADVQERAAGDSPTSSSSGLPRIGEYFIRRGTLTGEQVTKVARRQDELLRSGNRIAFGQVAYELGYISRSQLDAALAEQRNDFNQRFSD